MAVEAIVKVQKKGSPPKIKKKVTISDGQITVEKLGDDAPADLEEGKRQRDRNSRRKRNTTVPVGKTRRKKLQEVASEPSSKYKVAQDDVGLSARATTQLEVPSHGSDDSDHVHEDDDDAPSDDEDDDDDDDKTGDDEMEDANDEEKPDKDDAEDYKLSDEDFDEDGSDDDESDSDWK